MTTATLDPAPDVIRRLSATDWSLRAGVALAFAVFAAEKLLGSNWIGLFDAIGVGQWFRYFTGAVQLAGALLLLVPVTARVGGVLMGSTMVGAIFVHMAVLDTGVGGAIIPAALLPLVITAAWKGRGELVERSGFTLRS